MKKLLTIMMLVVMAVPNVAFADEVDEQLAAVKVQLESFLAANKSVSDCQETLVPLFDVEIAEFYKFMDDHFKNKSSTSSLVNNVIARYRQYKFNIQEHLLQLQTADPQSIEEGGNPFTSDTSLELYRECQQLSELYIDLAKEQMFARIQSSSRQKRSTIFVEKYRSVNDRMRTLNLEMSQMFGYFMTFQNKLPGFLNECVAR